MQGRHNKDHSLAKSLFSLSCTVGFPLGPDTTKHWETFEISGALLLCSTLQRDPLDTWGEKEPLGVSASTSCSKSEYL